ncbi:caspase family protein [Bradyrhizobium sp. AS23.2]|uniref:caspase family protein n=1 Tax=Bradyrhizobium sp. AS23.2 TaxID=1680155 RepID=UPI0009F93901|nr:caspase family protein [Bradyrhizobium sp. AS23.2]
MMLPLVLMMLCLGTERAVAEKRVALVIGNSKYEKTAPLSNPANDATLIAEMFNAVGFDNVELRRDLKVNDMRRALRDFIDKSRDADVAVVYYAGHGIEVDGVNYLVPVDAVLERDIDVYDEALTLDRVLVSVEPAKQLRLVILDACRDNPFARSMKRTMASRTIGRGLAKVEPASANTLIAFASKAGSTAADGDGKNSPFTAALVKYITKPGLDLRRAFGYVRDDVLKSTGNRQEPYVYGSLGGDDVPLVPAQPSAPTPRADADAGVRRAYELALQAGEREGWEAFLQAYPDGFYSNLARVQLRKIAAEEIRAAAAEKARLAELERARLAAQGAQQAEQIKAAEAVKRAEEARIAAEKATAAEREKAAAAEGARLAAQEKLVGSAEKRVAALNPSATADLSPAALISSLQQELRRVGCLSDATAGIWSSASERSLALFNKNAGTMFDPKAASVEALDAVKTKTGRVCPLTCGNGYRPEGDRCTRIACRSGYHLNEEGVCQKVAVNKPSSREEGEGSTARERPAARAVAAQASGTYKQCMGPLPGCYERAMSSSGAFRGNPEGARRWCTRAPTC